jgi:hypothetical protein
MFCEISSLPHNFFSSRSSINTCYQNRKKNESINFWGLIAVFIQVVMGCCLISIYPISLLYQNHFPVFTCMFSSINGIQLTKSKFRVCPWTNFDICLISFYFISIQSKTVTAFHQHHNHSE